MIGKPVILELNFYPYGFSIPFRGTANTLSILVSEVPHPGK